MRFTRAFTQKTARNKNTVDKFHVMAVDHTAVTMNQGVESGVSSSEISTELTRPPLWRRAKAVVFKHFLPICLIFSLVFGIVVPQPGVFFSELPTQYVCVVGLFLHSGLKLKTGEVKDALKSFKALIWGIVCILFITPIIGGQLTGLLPFQKNVAGESAKENGAYINGNHSSNNVTPSPVGDHLEGSSILGPALFQIGIQIYFIVPCTISAGVILVSLSFYHFKAKYMYSVLRTFKLS